MNTATDPQLLRDYTEDRSESAFAELARRHVDFVYSAAWRMVRDPHLAEDVTQDVFVALAQNARQLTKRPVLSGWLHRTAQNLAANAIRTDVRRRIREQTAAIMHELSTSTPDASWEQIAPELDAALGELSEPDRDALLLRYFERKSARQMAHILGLSDEAAQKRVHRAVERLRDYFSKRNLTIGASGLAVVISAKAVRAAPAGMAANNGVLPLNLLPLKPFYDTPVTDDMLQRYAFVQTGTLSANLSEPVVREAAPNVDEDYDSNSQMSMSGASGSIFNNVKSAISQATWAYTLDNNGQPPTDPSQIASYLNRPIDGAALQKYFGQVTADMAANLPPAAAAALAPAFKAYAAANNGQMPQSPSDLLPYLATPDQQAALRNLYQNTAASK